MGLGYGTANRGARATKRCASVAAAILLAVVVLFLLSGCKYSDVLTQHIEDPDLGILDESAEPIYQPNPDAEPRPDLADLSIDDSDDVNTQVQMLPHYDPAAPDNGPTKQRVKSPDTPHDEEASEGEDQTQEPDRTGDNPADEGDGGGGEEGEEEGGEADSPEAPEDDNESGENEGDGEELSSDEVEDGTQSEDAGVGDTTVIIDPEGTNEDSAKGTVAAVGEYATIAQMLGGAGALAACDQSWLDARSVDGAFSGELDRVQVAFAGDGTEEGCCDVDALVNTIKPSVVLWDSAKNIPALSDADRSSLEEAGITVQPMPPLGEMTTEDYDITQTVNAVASVLEGASGLSYDPVYVLSEYLSFHDNVLNACYSANGGYSYKVTDGQYAYVYQNTPLSGLNDSTTTRIATVYADSMMYPSVSSAVVSQTASTVDGTIRLAHDSQSLDVSDGVALSATTNTQGYMLMDYYLQLAGIMNNAYDTPMPESQGRPYIIMPGSTNAFGTSSTFASRSTASALFYNAGDGTVTANWHVLGNADFPAMLVANGEVADAIVNSASKENGLYRMESPYQVIVVPTGLAGIWTEGHVDSFLLAPWSFRVANPENLSTAAEYASAFYSKFFRCTAWEDAIADWDSAYTAG